MLPIVALLSLALICAHALPLRAASPLRLMPLGDSITEATDGRASYRYWLWHLLRQGGYPVEFVGSQVGVYQGTPKYPDFDPHHEGHWGWRADAVLARLEQWARTAQPDVVLCHLGTNDLLHGESVPSTVAEVGQIVEALRRANPRVTILLAQLIPAHSGQDTLQAFNRALPALATEKTSSASPVLVVDQWSGFDIHRDTYDGLHPNEAGEKKMAQQWYNTLRKLWPDTRGKRLWREEKGATGQGVLDR
jgi:acyl-CoA thioesterase I